MFKVMYCNDLVNTPVLLNIKECFEHSNALNYVIWVRNTGKLKTVSINLEFSIASTTPYIHTLVSLGKLTNPSLTARKSVVPARNS